MKTKLLITALFILGISSSNAQYSTGTVSLGLGMTLKIDTNTTTATLTLTGSSTAWLGIGFGSSMSNTTDFFIWNGTTNRDYTGSSCQCTPTADTSVNQSWTVTSDTVASGVRTVVATRALVSTGDYTFLNNTSSIPVIFAKGTTSTTLAQHSGVNRGATTLTRTMLSTENNFSLNATSIFPNPSNGSFSIKANTTISKVSIYSLTGELIKDVNVENTEEKEIQVNGLSTGIYFVELQNETEKSWKKIIVE
jgi:hypothetical protein